MKRKYKKKNMSLSYMSIWLSFLHLFITVSNWAFYTQRLRNTGNSQYTVNLKKSIYSTVKKQKKTCCLLNRAETDKKNMSPQWLTVEVQRLPRLGFRPD